MIPDNPFILHSKLFDSVSKNDYPKKVKAYTDSYYMNEVKIESISKILILNRKYLSRIFKEKYNITMQEYLIKKRMQEAKKCSTPDMVLSRLLTWYGIMTALIF